MKKMILRLTAFFISVFILIPNISVHAQNAAVDPEWSNKIDSELWTTMEHARDDELIPINLWLENIEEDKISDKLTTEYKMDPRIYENQELFYAEIAPAVVAEVERIAGQEIAHRSVDPLDDKYTLDVNGAYHDNSISIAKRAVDAKLDEYFMTKRKVVSDVYSQNNCEFIATHIEDSQRISYSFKYIPLIQLKATKSEIEQYAKLFQVVEISLNVDVLQKAEMYYALEQIDAGYNGGTKGDGYNNSNGYKGTGIKIGIIEAENGMFDELTPHLVNIPSTRLEFWGDRTEISNSGSHATIVTSIIVGQAVTVQGTSYEGIVPLATVYQAPIIGANDLKATFESMADRGVTVINYSGGSATDSCAYTELDKTIDQLIKNTGVTFVTSSGNIHEDENGNAINHYITSPGKALDAIVVGNAETLYTTATSSNPPHGPLSAPYGVRYTSAYRHADYLANKPDVVAPGSHISVIKSIGENSAPIIFEAGLYGASGTSYAAPFVTGLVAQIQEAGTSYYRNYPWLVKAMIMLGADETKIKNNQNGLDSNNSKVDDSLLWEKSGAGLINACISIDAVEANSTWGYSRFFNTSTPAITTAKYFSAGSTVRAVLTFEKSADFDITQSTTLDNLNFYLIDSNGNQIASSCSDKDNVEVLEVTIEESGYYSFNITPIAINGSSIYYYYVWDVS